jgi:CRP-like cAMP-binding protein
MQTRTIDKIKEAIQSLSPITDEAWNDFSGIWEPYAVKRKEIITAAGDREKYLYFVVDGIQRIYYLDDNNREATLLFTYAPSFGGVLDSFLLQKPSAYYYESLTPSTFYRAPYEQFHPLINQHKSLARFIQKALIHSVSGLLERMVELQSFSSEEKFKSLLKRSPHILTLVPHKYLANYLGIDPTNFSKLINSVRI